jgi:hypothetical protein
MCGELFESCGECVEVEGFREMRVKAGSARSFDVVRAAKAGDRQNRHFFPAFDFPQALQKLEAVHLRHRDV